MARAREIEAANVAIHASINDLAEEGHDLQDLANVMMAYALHSMVKTHGRQDVARHLFALAVKFADEDHNPLDRVLAKH